ncbi:MAG TPA: VWA domain-containing protein [Saprospiraceae bacterium]|nr:VWA domain-containing protein [Saprospiraceae bacterium]
MGTRLVGPTGSRNDKAAIVSLKRWRLILGAEADQAQEEDEAGQEGQEIALDETETQMDAVLEALYDAGRDGGLGSSAPNVNRWLGDIRKYFPKPVVRIMQQDAIERLGLKELLLEPELLEQLEPDVHLVATLLSLQSVIPEKTRSTASMVVRKLVDRLEEKLKNQLLQAVRGALHRAGRKRNPKLNEIDLRTTIRLNLKHYQPKLKTIIAEELIGFPRKSRQLKTIILLVDQSGSMASSVVYAGIFGCVLATMKSIKTHVIAFDTSIVDLTEKLDDPVDLLFGTQIGGGTDIGPALQYAQNLVERPEDTVLVLISDLFDGGGLGENGHSPMLTTAQSIVRSGVNMITLLALDDEGTPAYDENMAQDLRQLNVPVFACTPDLFPDLMGAALKRESLDGFGSFA